MAVSYGDAQEGLSKEVTFEQKPERKEDVEEEHSRKRDQQEQGR